MHFILKWAFYFNFIGEVAWYKCSIVVKWNTFSFCVLKLVNLSLFTRSGDRNVRL